jgi:hypothetical protein
MAQGCQTPDDNWCLTEQAHHQACTAAAASGDDVGVATCEWCPARRPAGPSEGSLSLPVFSHPFLSLGCSLSFSLDHSVAHSLKHTLSLFAVCSLALLLSLAHARALSLSLFHGFSHGLFGEGVREQTAMVNTEQYGDAPVCM